MCVKVAVDDTVDVVAQSVSLFSLYTSTVPLTIIASLPTAAANERSIHGTFSRFHALFIPDQKHLPLIIRLPRIIWH